MTPFTIQCTTCRRSLRVVDPEAIGQILACPKCGSMVLVQPNAELASESQDAVAITESVAAPVVPVIAMQVVPKELPAAPVAPIENTFVPDQIAASQPASLVAAFANRPAAPIEPVIAQTPPQAVVAETLQAGQWPRWFFPSLVALASVCLLIFAVRMMSSGGKNEAPPVASVDAPIEAANSTATAPPAEPTATSAVSETAAQSEKQSPPETSHPEQPTANQNSPGKSADKQASNDPLVKPPAQPPATSVAAPSVAKPQQENSPPPIPDQVVLQDPVPQKVPSTAISADIPEGPASTAPATSTAATELKPSQSAPPPRTLQRAVPRQVNVDAHLGDPLMGIDVHDMPLWAYLNLLSELSSIPITLDAQAVVNLGQSSVTPVQVKLEQTTVAGSLDAALDPLRLGYQVRDGQLIVGYMPQENMRQVRYAVGDLTEGDQKTLAEFASLVRRMVAPESWQQSGGKATMLLASDTLVIDQSDPAHLEVLTFCEKLRVARDKPLKSKYDPARFVLTTHTDKAHEILNKPVTANFGAPQPLSSVVNWLRAKTGVVLLIDQAALARQGMSAESECTVVAAEQPLSAVLDALVTPLELTWRAIDEKTIEITTQQAAAAQMDVEFYPVHDLAADAAKGHALAARISAKVDPQAWGEDSTKSTVYFDVPGRTLIVRAPQAVQSHVESYLASQHKSK